MHVLVTVFWHVRSTAAMVDRYSARVWAPSTSRAAVERRSGVVTDVFRPGDALPGGIEAFRTARRTEVVFWIPQHRALVPGDVLLGDDARRRTHVPGVVAPGEDAVIASSPSRSGRCSTCRSSGSSSPTATPVLEDGRAKRARAPCTP